MNARPMQQARKAELNDLAGVLALFNASDVSDVAEDVTEIWGETIGSPHVAVFVAHCGADIVASAMLITAPNLLRKGHRHGFLENVVTHPAHQGRGYGTAVVRAALQAARDARCYHVLLQSGRADPRVHAFYEGLGFEPGLRTGYVARLCANNAACEDEQLPQ